MLKIVSDIVAKSLPISCQCCVRYWVWHFAP